MYADSAVQNLQSTSLKGTYTVAQALDQILDKNRLNYELVDNNMIVIKQKTPDPAQLPEVKVTGYVDEDPPGNPSYTRTNATSGTKTDTSIFNTPVTVQVVSKVVINDQQAIGLGNVLQNISGVSPGWGFGASA